MGAFSPVPVPRVAILGSDVTHTQSSTTFENITGLSVAVDAERTYLVIANLMVDSLTTADVKIRWTLPAGATFVYTAIYPTTATAAQFPVGNIGAATAVAAGGVSPAAFGAIVVIGTLRVGANAGTLQGQFAQNTSDPSDTKILEDSSLALFPQAA